MIALSVIFVFLDGFGLGRADESNPFHVFPAQFMHGLLGTRLERGLDIRRPHLLARGIDAGLGVPGVPQSATGQTALFTGVNAPALVGEHVAAYPNGMLQKIIAEHSILKQAVERGHRATFANAYSMEYWQLVAERRLRHSASTLTNMAAGLPFRDFEDLRQGKALYWDITHSTFRLRFGRSTAKRYPYRHPREAGRLLATLAHEYDLVLFESFLPDAVGHRRLPHTYRWTVYMLDNFLEGLITALRPNDTLVLSSDHGNFEDMGTQLHTENPVPLMVVGPAALQFDAVERITEITPAILATLDQA